ncbi:YkgJ family cysteine cluster protein [Haloferacaceae archaeon DSL9]
MRVNCAGCAGCCIDWRPITPDSFDPERRDPRTPLDDVYKLVPLRRDEVHDFVDAGWGDALTPRLFRAAPDDESVTVDGYDLAAIDGKPVFYIGIRKTPKPVGPFETEPRWLDTCIFLDPETLRCRIHEDDRYPVTCSTYPGDNLWLGRDTECERVEDTFGGERLLDAEPPADAPTTLFGPAAIGAKVFLYPDPEALEGVVERIATHALTREDRSMFVGAAAGSSPGTDERNDDVGEAYRRRMLEADSWIGRLLDTWPERAGELGSDASSVSDPDAIERDCGAPDVPPLG